MEINIEHKQKFILKNKVKKFIYQPSYESSIIRGRLDKELKIKIMTMMKDIKYLDLKG